MGYGLVIGFTGLFDTAQTTLYSLLLNTHTSVHSHVFTNRCSVVAFNNGCSPSSGFPDCPRASATRFSQQQLTTIESHGFSNSLTHQSTD
jgi:hypothetical protein